MSASPVPFPASEALLPDALLPDVPLAAPPSLVGEDLGHAFGARVLFRQVGFTLDAGQTLVLVGRNGAGKSTLATILAGLRRPRKGRARLRLGASETALPRHAALVAPYLGLYDALTPAEHLALIADARAEPGLAARARSVLEAVGLARRADDSVGTFSSGMRQRVRYACALLAAPPLLVLDEPTATLDADGAALVDAVRAWQRARGGLLVVATNEPDEATWGDQTVRIGAPS